ncbi:hypothetical protein RI367_000022 [Sorochytrium milnesiophthora]
MPPLADSMRTASSMSLTLSQLEESFALDTASVPALWRHRDSRHVEVEVEEEEDDGQERIEGDEDEAAEERDVDTSIFDDTATTLRELWQLDAAIDVLITNLERTRLRDAHPQRPRDPIADLLDRLDREQAEADLEAQADDETDDEEEPLDTGEHQYLGPRDGHVTDSAESLDTPPEHREEQLVTVLDVRHRGRARIRDASAGPSHGGRRLLRTDSDLPAPHYLATSDNSPSPSRPLTSLGLLLTNTAQRSVLDKLRHRHEKLVGPRGHQCGCGSLN